MTPRQASMASFNDSVETTGGNEESEFGRTMIALLSPSRLAALDAADVAPVLYDGYSFFSNMLVVRGRNFSMLVTPLSSLFIWGLSWHLLFWYGTEYNQMKFDVTDVREYLVSMEKLIGPLITPISFLLVFRLGRSAVRFWDVSVFYAQKCCSDLMLFVSLCD